MVQQISTYSRSLVGARGLESNFLDEIVRWSWIVYIFCVLFQIIFYFDLVNVMAMASVALAWGITTKFLLKPGMLERFPFSVFLLFGFTTTQFYFPLVFTSLEGKSLIFNLDVPELVFFHSTAALFVLLLAHSFYRLLTKLSGRRSFSFLEKTGFFTPPTERQLWLMGVIGIAAAYFVYFTTPTAEEGREVTGEASDKFIQGFLPFQYAPFFIPLSRLFGGNEVDLKKVGPLLIAYTVALFAISVGRNSTGAFMFGFTAVAFGYALGLMLGVYKARLFTLKNALIVALGGWLLVGPMADLRTAMVNVREQRTSVSAMELLDLTLEAFQDKEAIRERRLYDETQDSEWDERYLSNVFTARFANIKFNDINLVQALEVREHDPDMLNFSKDYLLGGLPAPFLKALNLDVDKEAVYGLSVGDYLYLAAGGYGTPNAYRSGHFAGTGMAAFGWYYLLILGVGMVLIFYLFDKFYMLKYLPGPSPDQPKRKVYLFSFCGLLALNSVFLYTSALQTVVQIGTFVYRGWIQLALLYFLVFHFTRIFSGSFMKDSELVKTLKRLKI